MLGLNQKEGRIFRFALIGHIVLGLFLFIYSFVPSCEEEPEIVHVFELASTPLPPTPQVRPTPPNPIIGSLERQRSNPPTKRMGASGRFQSNFIEISLLEKEFPD